MIGSKEDLIKYRLARAKDTYEDAMIYLISMEIVYFRILSQ